MGDGGVTFLAATPATVTTTFDAQGRPQQSIAHDSEHQPVAIINRQYDEQGRLQTISTTMMKRSENLLPAASGDKRVALEQALDQLFPKDRPMSITTFRYDGQGRVIERSASISQLQSERTITTYNEQGDELTVATFLENREFSLHEDGVFRPTIPERPDAVPHENRFTYVYDEHANWIEQQLISAPQVQTVETRELTYW